MIAQNLESGISHDTYENACHILLYNENGHDGERNHQTALSSLETTELLPVKPKLPV